MRVSLHLGALAAAAMLFTGAQAFAQPTEDAIANTLQTRGAAATLSQYFQCSNGAGYQFVEGGNPHAVAMAAKILPEAGRCAEAKLQSALRLALIYNPAVVLPFVNSGPLLSAADICKPSGLPDDAPSAPDKSVAQEMKGSLGTVTSAKLAAQKQACLQVIAGS